MENIEFLNKMIEYWQDLAYYYLDNVSKYETAARDAMKRLDWREAEAEIERLLTEFCAQA